MGLYQIKNILHRKGNNYQNEDTTYRMLENHCQGFITKIINIPLI
jgi:hypothetical protein